VLAIAAGGARAAVCDRAWVAPCGLGLLALGCRRFATVWGCTQPYGAMPTAAALQGLPLLQTMFIIFLSMAVPVFLLTVLAAQCWFWRHTHTDQQGQQPWQCASRCSRGWLGQLCGYAKRQDRSERSSKTTGDPISSNTFMDIKRSWQADNERPSSRSSHSRLHEVSLRQNLAAGSSTVSGQRGPATASESATSGRSQERMEAFSGSSAVFGDPSLESAIDLAQVSGQGSFLVSRQHLAGGSAGTRAQAVTSEASYMESSFSSALVMRAMSSVTVRRCRGVDVAGPSSAPAATQDAAGYANGMAPAAPARAGRRVVLETQALDTKPELTSPGG
jgi:hypothetical protein